VNANPPPLDTRLTLDEVLARLAMIGPGQDLHHGLSASNWVSVVRHHVIRTDDPQALERLLPVGVADAPFKIKGDRYTLVHLLARHGSARALAQAVSWGLPVNVTTKRSDTPIGLAVQHGNVQACKVLVEAGSFLGAVSRSGHTLLSQAILAHNRHMVDYLLSVGADALKPDLNGFCPLHLAAAENQSGIIDSLLVAGQDINQHAANKKKWTPLHYAIDRQARASFEILVRRGADADRRPTLSDSTSYDYASPNQQIAKQATSKYPAHPEFTRWAQACVLSAELERSTAKTATAKRSPRL
jgi:ankyrin repeat protein